MKREQQKVILQADLLGSTSAQTFVSYARHATDVWHLARSAATGKSVTWTVHRSAKAGDLVAFYCMNPLAAFIAHGRVVRRSKDRFGRSRKPMADVGLIQLFPKPVTIQDAKRKLGFPWLRTAQGFELRPCEGVELLIALGKGS